MLRSPCEEWQGSRDKEGYGRLHLANTSIKAHRLIYMQHHGHSDLQILHDCDNPPCINMDHLRAGTVQDNVDDKMKRGRDFHANMTHCKQGHEYTNENTYVWRNNRKCRKCGSINAQRRRDEKKEVSV